MTPPILLAVPNVSEGRDARRRSQRSLSAFADDAAERRCALLDVHADADHHRSVFTLAGRARRPRGRAAARRARRPSSGSTSERRRRERDRPASARGRARCRADRLPDAADAGRRVRRGARARRPASASELELPVFLYGELTGTDARRAGDARAAAPRRRRGARARMAAGERRCAPDFGPPRLHPSAGATLVAARAPLVAFNLQLAPPADARRRARDRRADPRRRRATGCRACARSGVAARSGGVAQVSMNVERPFELPLAEVVDAVAGHAEVAAAELVGLAPRRRARGFPRMCRCRASIPRAT